jgi:DNA topoisomerase VI subunit A
MDPFIKDWNLTNMVCVTFCVKSTGVPSMKWIGLSSQDIEELNLITSPLSVNDVSLLNRLIEDKKRNQRFENELKLMKERNVKCEIQSLNNLGFTFLSGVYLKTKLLKRIFL